MGRGRVVRNSGLQNPSKDKQTMAMKLGTCSKGSNSCQILNEGRLSHVPSFDGRTVPT